MLDRNQAPAIQDAVAYSVHLKTLRSFRLRNGIPVYAVKAGPQDVLQVEFVFDAGNAFERGNLIAASTNYLLKNGTKRLSAFDINDHFEYYGAYLNRNCHHETSNLVLHCLNRHLPELLPVLREVLTESVFPQTELDIYRQNMKQRLAVNLKKCEFVAGRLIDAYLFGEGHPYGKFSRPEDYDALTRDQLLEFYRAHYLQGRCRIFVAGQLPADVDSLLDQFFGDLGLSDEAVPPAPATIVSARDRTYRVSNDPDGVQGAIRLGSLFPNKHHPDYPKAQVLNTVFGGYFGSRLMSNIREDKGYTYGIHSYLQGFPQSGAWMVSTEAGRDVCESALKEVYHEMQRLRETPIGEEELQLVRNYLIGTLLGDLDGPFQIIARWKSLLLQDLGLQYFDESVRVIKTIGADELQSLANKYLLPEKFYELVVI